MSLVSGSSRILNDALGARIRELTLLTSSSKTVIEAIPIKLASRACSSFSSTIKTVVASLENTLSQPLHSGSATSHRFKGVSSLRSYLLLTLHFHSSSFLALLSLDSPPSRWCGLYPCTLSRDLCTNWFHSQDRLHRRRFWGFQPGCLWGICTRPKVRSSCFAIALKTLNNTTLLMMRWRILVVWWQPCLWSWYCPWPLRPTRFTPSCIASWSSAYRSPPLPSIWVTEESIYSSRMYALQLRKSQ